MSSVPSRGRGSIVLGLVLLSPFMLWMGASGEPARERAQMEVHAATAAAPVGSGDEPRRAPTHDPRSPSAFCVGRLLAPISELSGEIAEGKLAADPAPPWLDRVSEAGQRLRQALSAGPAPPRVEVVIATVADPVDSGLGYQFETALQAIRAGFEHTVAARSSGSNSEPPDGAYFRDRSFLPWDDRELAAGDRAEAEACRREVPGVMLFRNSDPLRPRVLAVLLVGETPTSGVHAAALMNALDVAEALELPRGTPRPNMRRVRVLGPMFSGSAYSLRLALRNWASAHPEPRLAFDLKSGTASGSEVHRLLGDHGSVLTPESNVAFAATTVPETAADCAYLWYLRTRLRARPERGGGNRLPGVATLHESGTEFGASSLTPNSTASTSPCPLAPAVSLTFPVHISFLRDAYESMDRRDAQRDTDATIARATSLGASLHEQRVPLDVEANPSEKTQAALDVMLSSVLGEISRREIHHVGIHATDIGDAIFLARKIRDVAPDVRLAFFEPDALLVHPEFRRDLLGSLVVTPYPFLGVNDFSSRASSAAAGTREYTGFASALAEGLFNAVLAQRQAPATELFDYTFEGARTPLPIWVSTISRAGLVPIEVRPALDCAGTIYGTPEPNPADSVCNARPPERAARWREFNQVRGAELPIERTLALPRFWNFLYMVLVFAFLVDTARQKRLARRLADDPMPGRLLAGDDRHADRAIGRTKWWLYASIRTFLFVLAFCYMAAVYGLAFVARGGFSPPAAFADSPLAWLGYAGSTLGVAAFVTLTLALAARQCGRHFATFVRDYWRFGKIVGARLVPWTWNDFKDGLRSGPISSKPTGPNRSPFASKSRLERWSLSLGLYEPVGRLEAARVSFAQLRLIVAFSVLLAVGFTSCLIADAFVSADWALSKGGETAVPALTLTVLRSVSILNGVSPATPVLLCMGCVYVWAVGRMARLALAHKLSRLAPRDGETDLVSTPIRLILYPRYAPEQASDEGFTRIERDVLNAIWRPITGPYYVFALFTLTFFPSVLFALKPLSTLEGLWGTILLGGGLTLSALLIGVTLVQLVQYWICLERLLKRVMAQRLGAAFENIPSFARDSLEDQISRSPNELLRFVACSQQFSELILRLRSLGRVFLAPDVESRLEARERELASAREQTLLVADGPEETGCEAAALGEGIVVAAAEISDVLERACAPARPAAAEAASEPDAEAPRVSHHEELAPPHVALAASGTSQLESATDAAFERPMHREFTRTRGESLRASGAGWHIVHDAEPSEPPAAIDGSVPAPTRLDAEQAEWVKGARAFIATVVALLIHRHVRQFRHFFSTLTACALLLLLAVTSYPFEPYRLLLTFIWVIMGSVVGTGLWIYIQLDRNTLISHMSGTSPDHVTFNGALALRLLGWAIIPLIGVAAAQYPELANLLYRVIAPFTRALK